MRTKLTDEEFKRKRESMDLAIASVKMEGLTIQEEDLTLLDRVAKGEVSREDANAAINLKYSSQARITIDEALEMLDRCARGEVSEEEVAK